MNILRTTASRFTSSRRTVRSIAPTPAILATALLGLLAACGGGGDGATGPGPITRIEVSSSSVTLTAIGATQTVTATPRDAKGVAVTSSSVVWTSDNPTIASVSSSGASATITAVGTGATVLRARAGGFGGDVSVQVLGVRAIQVTPSNTSIRAGDSQPFSASFDADVGVSTAVTWTTGSTAIATVTPAGLVTGVSPGTTTVKATSVADPRFFATGTLTVVPARGVVITPNAATIATGEQRTLSAQVNIESGLSTNVTWRSSSASIASVTQAGVVTGVAFGTASITAIAVADTTLRSTATIDVVPVVRSVTVSPTTASLQTGNTQQLTATVNAEGTLAKTVNWISSNNSVATVSGTGLVTAVSIGTATISAISTVDTTKRANATITIVARPVAVSIVQRAVGINPGTSTTLTATVTGDPGISTVVTWTSSTPTVASISQAGLVSGLTAGTTLVTATAVADPSKKDTVTVTVVPRLAGSWNSTRLNGILYDDLISVVAFSNFSAFAINSINGGTSGGDVYSYDGSNWVLSARGSTFNTTFLAVHGATSTNVIAVGTNGVVVRWNGTTWTPMTSGTTRTLRGIFAEDANTAYAVGDNGTALKWNGTAWSALTTNSTQQLNGVWSSGLNTIMVGSNGEALKYNGTSVQRQTISFSDDLTAVSGVPGGSVTAVGRFGGVLRYDGTSWTLVNSNGVIDDFYTVSGTAANSGRMYIGGQNGVYQLDGTTLTSAAPNFPVSVFAISVDAFGNPWAVGQRGSVQRGAGASWTTVNFAPDLLDVWTTSANNAWAVGEYGFVYRWNGSTWTRQSTPSLANLYAVWAPSSNDAFAGGDNGTMLRWTGSAWTSMTLPSTARVFAMWGSSASNVFAATDVGEILRYNGTTWTLQTTAPGGATLLSLYGVSANEAYATGTGGLVMKYNGTAWSTLTAPDAVTTLFGVWMSGSNNIVAVGADQSGATGFGFTFNGTAWQTMNMLSAKALTSVWGPSVFDLYATGDVGTMLRFNGSGWQTMPTGTTDLLWSVSGAPDASGGAFAVGINTTMVTGSASGALRTASAAASAAARNFDLSYAARHDPRASGRAATGAARRNKALRARIAQTRRAR